MNGLDVEEKIRYSRQIAVDGFGQESQEKLKVGSVAIIGCGALGSLAGMYLAGAGIGRIVIADFDTIDISNLHRQLFFATSQNGESKALTLRKRMKELNPLIDVTVIEQFITERNAADICSEVDIVIDGSDNPDTKYMLEKVCARLEKPLILAGVNGMKGQIMTILPGSTRFSDIFPPVSSEGVTPCSISGVVGPAAGVASSIMSAECIKLLSGCGTPLTDRIITFDLKSGDFRSLLL